MHKNEKSDRSPGKFAKTRHIAVPADKGRTRWLWIPVALFWLILWQLLYMFIHQDLLLASPLQVFASLSVLCLKADFWLAALFSLLRIQAGFLLAVVCGTLLAILTSSVAWINHFVFPAISAVRSTPIASFIILALVWMSSSKVVIFIVFLMVLPIVWTNVTEGIRKIDPKLLEMAAVFELSRRQIFRVIDVPSVSPFFVTAATTGLGLAWKAGIAAEVLSTPADSLGGRLYEAKIYLETPDLLAYTIVIILLSLLLEKVMVFVFRKTSTYFRHHGRTQLPAPTQNQNRNGGEAR